MTATERHYLGTHHAFREAGVEAKARVWCDILVTEDRVTVQKVVLIAVEGPPYVRTATETLSLDMDQAEDVATALRAAVDAYQVEMRNRSGPVNKEDGQW